MSVVRFLVGQFRGAPSKRSFLRSLRLGSQGGSDEVRSADGTAISMRRSGTGPALVMVHGTLDGMGAWAFVEPPFGQEFTVSVYDRRGRGGSGDTDPWSIEREVDDLAAVVAATGGPTHVVAHSFGAVIAMRACLAGVPMRSLVLYEPPMNGDAISQARLEEIGQLVEREDFDTAIRTMAQQLAGVSDDEIAVALSVPPVRKALRDGVRTAPREIEALRSLEWGGLPIRGTPVLLVHGGLTDVAAYPRPDQTESIAADIEIVEIPGQRHLAHTFAPSSFVTPVAGFLRRHTQGD